MSSLRIGVDGDALRPPFSGVGYYVFNLCCELEVLLPNASFIAYSRLPATDILLPSPALATTQRTGSNISTPAVVCLVQDARSCHV